MRRQGAKGLSVTRKTKISRRQFLTGGFRGRKPTKTDLSTPNSHVWTEAPEYRSDFKASETEPHSSDRDEAMERVLVEMEDLTGIEDF